MAGREGARLLLVGTSPRADGSVFLFLSPLAVNFNVHLHTVGLLKH